jgi:NifU-like protein involved in Fe-S cluster formation
MEEAVVKYFRELLRQDFPNAGEIEDASVFAESVGEKMINCGNTGNYMQLYLKVAGGRIDDIRYLCSCEPTANVAVELLCTLARGKALAEAEAITPETFYQVLGCSGQELQVKVRGLLELLAEGIARYRGQAHPCLSSAGAKREWDWRAAP